MKDKMKEILMPVPRESKKELLHKCASVLSSYLHNGYSEEQFKWYVAPLKGVAEKLLDTMQEDHLSLNKTEAFALVAIIMMGANGDD